MSEKEKLNEMEMDNVSGGTQGNKKIDLKSSAVHYCPKCGKEVDAFQPHKITPPVSLSMQHLYDGWCDECVKGTFEIRQSNDEYNPR